MDGYNLDLSFHLFLHSLLTLSAAVSCSFLLLVLLSLERRYLPFPNCLPIIIPMSTLMSVHKVVNCIKRTGRFYFFYLPVSRLSDFPKTSLLLSYLS